MRGWKSSFGLEKKKPENWGGVRVERFFAYIIVCRQWSPVPTLLVCNRVDDWLVIVVVIVIMVIDVDFVEQHWS